MPAWILEITVIDGPFPFVVWGLTLACALALLIRRPTSLWVRRALLGILIGATAGLVSVLLANVTNAFGGRLPGAVAVWAGLCLAMLGLAVVSLWASAVWRKVVAGALVVLSLLSATLGINAAFGIDSTIGAMLGISTVAPIAGLPEQTSPDATPTGPLYASWTPPADMPATGTVGLLAGEKAIPSTAGFTPRDASIYLPPAALVKNAPALPFVVMMMGQPGNPDPTTIAAVLDEVAASNRGLAPIVIVADQLGQPDHDPACADSSTFGGVSTYVNHDIVAYAKSTLNIIQDPAFWTIAGYSNGGACAFTWGAQYPATWGNVISVSGDEFPGAEIQGATLADVFHGDQAAYDASMPAVWLQKNSGQFTGHVAVFTVGGDDQGFLPGARRNATLAENAGFATTYHVIPGAGHVADALPKGLKKAFEVLYPRLGLASP